MTSFASAAKISEWLGIPEVIRKHFKKKGDSTIPLFQAHFFHLLEHVENNGSRKFIKTFQQLKTNNERVNLIHEKLEKLKLLDDKFTLDAKSDSKAKHHRDKGDTSFSTGKFGKAYRCYTKMLMQAFTPELITTAYTKRSAALFELKLYEECMTDIDRALSGDCDEEVIRTLMTRKAKALKLEKKSKTAMKPYEETPQIPTHRRNPVLHCASNSIEVKNDSKSRRRRVVAAKDIKVGEVIAVESPFCAVVGESRLYHCHDCFELCYALIPCDNCTETLYCSDTCRQNAYNKYHKDECPILKSLKDLVGEDKQFLLGIKMALFNQDEQADEILKYAKEVDDENWFDGQFKTSITAAFVYDLVKKHTQKLKGSNGEQMEKTFKDTVLNYLRICTINTAGVDEICPNNDSFHRDDHEVVATAIYPIFGLFRHSCCPNVFACHHGVRRVMRAQNSIKRGQECFISFGMQYHVHPKGERQNQLYRQYRFKCKCRACKEDWPQIGKEVLSQAILSDSDMMCLYELMDINVEFAKRIMPKFLQQIEQLEQFEPHADLITQQKLLRFCCDLLGNKRMIL